MQGNHSCYFGVDIFLFIREDVDGLNNATYTKYYHSYYLFKAK